MGQMEGKVAIVTGAAVGIGRAIAIAFGKENAKIVVNYSKSRAEAEITAEEVRKAGGEPLLYQADVASDEQVRAMVAETLARFGRIDVLVNNAGITVHAPFKDLDAMTDDVWDRLFAVNVKGAFFCSRAVAEPMRKQGHGRIINFGSIAGIRPQGSSLAYSTVKAALIHMTECLAKTLGPEVLVNVIAPGFIENTRWNEGREGVEATRQGAIQAAALKRAGTPEDVADVALFLATRGDFVTGATIIVDGGRALA